MSAQAVWLTITADFVSTSGVPPRETVSRTSQVISRSLEVVPEWSSLNRPGIIHRFQQYEGFAAHLP
jgi:hypothetical protein